MSRFAGVLGPSTTLADMNAMLQIHPDNSALVLSKYGRDDRLRFQFLEESIQETHAPVFNRIQVLGRSENYLSYAGTENRKFSMTLGFSASAEQNDVGAYDMATRATRWLQSLCYPSYGDGGIMHPPPLCILVLGKFISARGVVTEATPCHKAPFVGRLTSLEYPLVAAIEFEFTSVNVQPLEASDFIPVSGRALPLDPSMASRFNYARGASSAPITRQAGAT